MKNIPTPVIAAILFAVTFIGTVAVYIAQGSVPSPFWVLDSLFAGAAVGAAVPNVAGSLTVFDALTKGPPDAAP